MAGFAGSTDLVRHSTPTTASARARKAEQCRCGRSSRGRSATGSGVTSCSPTYARLPPTAKCGLTGSVSRRS